MIRKKHIFIILSILFGILILHTINAQVNLQTEINNQQPNLNNIQTYSRYTNATENFPTTNFTICIGEQNRTIHIDFITEDKNSNTEITNGGNVTWKIVQVENGIEKNTSSFGNNSKEAKLNETINSTTLRYVNNITLTNNGTKALYRIITNITDSKGAYTENKTAFTLQKTDCVRVEENANLVTTEPFDLVVDYCHLNITVEENITGKIIITIHNESPTDNNVNEALDKYMTVDVEGTILQETINLTLLANYTQEEINSKGLNESSLRIYKWGSWNLQEGEVNENTNEVQFIVNESTIESQSYRLGTYSVRGNLLNNTNTESNTGSSGGGGSSSGGGGGGGSSVPLTGNAIEESTTEKERPNTNKGRGEELTEEIVTSTVGAFNTFKEFLTQIGKELKGEQPITPKHKPLCCLILLILLIIITTTAIIIITQKNKTIKKLQEQIKKQKLTYKKIGKEKEYFIK